MRRYVLILLSVLAWSGASADSIPVRVPDWMPRIGGAVRARWEMETEDGYNRFQLRNARVNLAGDIGRYVEYYLQVDLCNQGKMQFLDGWARVALFEGFKAQAGQFRIPFGIDTFRGPGNYVFANRSFLGRDFLNRRAVGFQMAYTIPQTTVTVSAGAFNPGTITDHTPWTRQKTYAAKAAAVAGDFSLSASYASDLTDSVRINMADAAVVYHSGRWHAEAEYAYKHYTHHAHRATHAVVVWGDYAMPVRAGVFNQASFQGRFDMMTAGSNSTRDALGQLTTNQPARRRITLGATLSRVMGSRHADFRVNYEKYFYNHDVEAPEGRGDKIVAEIVVKF